MPSNRGARRGGKKRRREKIPTPHSQKKLIDQLERERKKGKGGRGGERGNQSLTEGPRERGKKKKEKKGKRGRGNEMSFSALFIPAWPRKGEGRKKKKGERKGESSKFPPLLQWML